MTYDYNKLYKTLITHTDMETETQVPCSLTKELPQDAKNKMIHCWVLNNTLVSQVTPGVGAERFYVVNLGWYVKDKKNSEGYYTMEYINDEDGPKVFLGAYFVVNFENNVLKLKRIRNKTNLARAVTYALENDLPRIDVNEFMRKHGNTPR